MRVEPGTCVNFYIRAAAMNVFYFKIESGRLWRQVMDSPKDLSILPSIQLILH